MFFLQTQEDCGSVKVNEIRNERELYQAVSEYSSNVWQWGGYCAEGFDGEPAPDELIAILESRIAWVKAHKDAVDHYLNRRCGPHWVRVIDGSKAGDQSHG